MSSSVQCYKTENNAWRESNLGQWNHTFKMDAEAQFYAWAFSQKKNTQLDLSAVRFESLKGSFNMQCIGIHSKFCVSVYVSIKIKPLAASKQLWLSVQMAQCPEGVFRLWSLTQEKQTDRS